MNKSEISRLLEIPPAVSMRKGKNIANIINNKREKNEQGRTSNCGKRCKLCVNMGDTGHIRDRDGKEICLLTNINCLTRGVVYGIECVTCQRIIYVGKTENDLRTRFYTHRHHNKINMETPLRHFWEEHEEEDLNSMKIIGLERERGDDDYYRVERERYWTIQHKLV